MREPRSPGHCGDSIAGLRSWDDGVTAQAACRRGRPMADPTTIDEYLTTLPPDRRGPMEEIRRTVRAAAPDATETIAYKMPAFRSRGGRYLVGVSAENREAAGSSRSSATSWRRTCPVGARSASRRAGRFRSGSFAGSSRFETPRTPAASSQADPSDRGPSARQTGADGSPNGSRPPSSRTRLPSVSPRSTVTRVAGLAGQRAPSPRGLTAKITRTTSVERTTCGPTTRASARSPFAHARSVTRASKTWVIGAGRGWAGSIVQLA